MTQCYGCDKKYENNNKYCVSCTYNNYRANGYAVSIRECLNLSAPDIIRHPELVVKTVSIP